MNARRLERLSKLRRRLRDQQSARTAEAQASLSAGEQAHDQAQAAQEAFSEEAVAAMQAMTRVDEMWWLRRRQRAHEAQVDEAAEQVETLREASDASKAELRARTKDLRVMEMTLDRARMLAAEQELKREQRLVDDIVATETQGENA